MEPIALTAAARGSLQLVADLSFEQIRMFIERALRRRANNLGSGYCYVVATKDGTVVYESCGSIGPCQYFQESYQIDADGSAPLRIA